MIVSYILIALLYIFCISMIALTIKTDKKLDAEIKMLNELNDRCKYSTKGFIVYKEGICFVNFTYKDRECEVECDELYPDDLIVDVQVNENNTKEVLVDYKYRLKRAKKQRSGSVGTIVMLVMLMLMTLLFWFGVK